MNSLQQQEPSQESSTPEDYVTAFEAKLNQQDAAAVESLLIKLQFLGLHFDPFAGEIADECKQVMNNLGLNQHLANPYQATNLLLQLLDKTEERLNKLKQ
jgi:hypothetical protein